MQPNQEVKGYLEKLMKQHPDMEKIGQSLQQPIAKCQDQICNGRYNIKESEKTEERVQPVATVETTKMSVEEHNKFMERLLEEKRELRKKRKKRLQEEQSKEKQEQDEKYRKQQEERQRKAEEKKKELSDRLNVFEQYRKRRATEIDISNQAVQALKRSDTLHQRLMSNFLQSEASALQEKKKKLAQIRALHKPLSKDEFKQHERKLEQLREKVQGRLSKDQRSNSMSDIYKSEWYKKAKEENPANELSEKEAQETQKAKQVRDKLRKYSEYVKSNFKPEVDTKKASLMKEQIESTTHKPPELKGDEPKKIGLEYLKYSKEHIGHQSKTAAEIPAAQTEPKPINYLQQLKKNRQKKEPNHNFIESILKQPGDERSKADYLSGQVQRMEEQARRKEKLDRLSHKVVDEQLDELYVNTIKAKLALIK